MLIPTYKNPLGSDADVALYYDMAEEISDLLPKHVNASAIDPLILSIILQVLIQVLKYIFENYKICHFNKEEVIAQLGQPTLFTKMLIHRNLRKEMAIAGLGGKWEIPLRKAIFDYASKVDKNKVMGLLK